MREASVGDEALLIAAKLLALLGMWLGGYTLGRAQGFAAGRRAKGGKRG